MPEGDAARIYSQMRQLAQEAQEAGQTVLTVRVGEVVGALQLGGSNAGLNVGQVLTTKNKLTQETGLKLEGHTGSGSRLDSTFTFAVVASVRRLPGTLLSTRPATHIVTGATGYTGRYITHMLLERGDHVRSLTGHPDRPNPFGDTVVTLPYNFDDPDALTRSLEGTDTLFNTYWVRVAHRGLTHDRAASNLRTLFRAAEAAGVRRVVHISITNADADSPLSYFRCKGELEDALRASGLSHAILRPTLVFGTEDILLNNIAWMLRKFPMFLVPGSGKYRVQPICVEDLARLAVEMSDRDDNVELDAVGPEVFTYDEMLRLIARQTGTSTRLLHVHPSLVMLAGRMLGLLVRDIVLSRDEIEGLSTNLLVSNSSNPPPGRIHLSDWLDDHASGLGRHYANEMARHYR